MLDRVLKIAELYDFYGALLTEKQQRCLELHYLSDASLAEIAAEFSVSRQAVHDILRRSEQLLAEYEASLGLVERHRRDRESLARVQACLRALPDDCRRLPAAEEALALLEELLTR